MIGGTVALFVAALAGMQFVQQQFFPSSDRPELLVDLTLPQGSSINATRKVVDEIEKVLKTDPDIEQWSFYVGSGAIRFYLPLDQQLANDFFAQGGGRHQGLQGSRRRAAAHPCRACGAGIRTGAGARQSPRSSGRRSAGRSSSASAVRIR